jgi:hypothetical protein
MQNPNKDTFDSSFPVNIFLINLDETIISGDTLGSFFQYKNSFEGNLVVFWEATQLK